MSDIPDILDRLAAIIADRRHADPESSYVASLHAKGLNKILEKVGEEATETIIAAKDAATSGDTRELIHETADLWFHTLVMLDQFETPPASVLAELERRFGTSGIEEKSSMHTTSQSG